LLTGPSDIRVLVLGGTGMLGHKIWQLFRDRFDTWVTARALDDLPARELFAGDRAIPRVSADDFDSVVRACAVARPTVIVNCIGIVKQVMAAADPVPAISVNALFPHRAAALAGALGARLIHISTDCVFAGTRGHYSERDMPDAYDLYGRTKLLGEVTGPRCLTLRTSIVGRELSATTGLLEWFLAQRGGRAKGYTGARFSGLTTRTLAEVLADVVERHEELEGVYHVASRPISKYDLLNKLNDAFATGVDIEASQDVRIDRTLDGSAFHRATGLAVPQWDDMIAALAADPTPYEEWRRTRV
jgi:dTDP-4-dehydrorhamnose reductase